MNPTDTMQLQRATISGGLRSMEEIADAQAAIIALLNDTNLGLGEFRRVGLLSTLRVLNNELISRNEFLKSQLGEEGHV